MIVIEMFDQMELSKIAIPMIYYIVVANSMD
jgi:hypothetical protein